MEFGSWKDLWEEVGHLLPNGPLTEDLVLSDRDQDAAEVSSLAFAVTRPCFPCNLRPTD